jgi:hypothetical protein
MESLFFNFAERLVAENPERYAFLHDFAGYIMDRSCNPITHTVLVNQGNPRLHVNANQYIPGWSRLQHYAYGLFVPAHLYYASVIYTNLYYEMHTSVLLIPKPNGKKTALTVENLNSVYQDILNTDPVFRLFSAGDELGFIAAIKDDLADRLESSLRDRIAWIRTLHAFYQHDDVVTAASKAFQLLEQCRQQQLAMRGAQIAQ